MKYPPLPVEFWVTELKVRWEKWKHLDEKRRRNFTAAHVTHLVSAARMLGLLPKKPRKIKSKEQQMNETEIFLNNPLKVIGVVDRGFEVTINGNKIYTVNIDDVQDMLIKLVMQYHDEDATKLLDDILLDFRMDSKKSV